MNLKDLGVDLKKYLELPEACVNSFEALNEHIIRHPARFGRLMTFMNDAKAEMEKAEWELEVMEAELDKEIRGKLSDKKTTEQMIKKRIIRSKEYQSAYLKLLSTRDRCNTLSGLVKAMEHKLSILISLGANLRKEYFDLAIGKGGNDTRREQFEAEYKKMNQKRSSDD